MNREMALYHLCQVMAMAMDRLSGSDRPSFAILSLSTADLFLAAREGGRRCSGLVLSPSRSLALILLAKLRMDMLLWFDRNSKAWLKERILQALRKVGFCFLFVVFLFFKISKPGMLMPELHP